MPVCRERFGWNFGKLSQAVGFAAIAALAVSSGNAMAAACRVTDFTTRPLSSLNEVQRLSLVSEMTQTEFTRLHAEKAGSPNHYDLIAKADSVAEARQAALARLATVPVRSMDDMRQTWGSGLRNDDILDALQVDEYRRIWASDFLTDEELRKFADCISGRQPGLTVAGRPADKGVFNLTFAHITPIGIEKIATRVVASHNVANIAEFEEYLARIGMQDNYVARTFPLRLIDPARRAVVVMRAGWETPKFIYIPTYPTPDYFQ
jgi:hypothetical protein